MNSRIEQLDFLKSLCIILMVIFHLVFIGDKYPYAKEIVYTFHMPVFLLISGYLVHTDYPAKKFFLNQLWIFIPYLLLEVPYVSLSGILGVRGGDTNLSLPHLAYRVFIHPLGPYWYLHTLLICNISRWTTQQILRRIGWLPRLFSFAIVLAILTYGTGVIADNVIYYFFGTAISLSGIHFLQVFRPSFPALILGALLCCFPANLHYNAPGGIAITYFAINAMLWGYEKCNTKLLSPILFVGKNTLAIFLFSPIFTMAVKPLVSLLSFDHTGMIFMVLSTIIAIGGSLAIAFTMDQMKLSRWFCGRHRLLCH